MLYTPRQRQIAQAPTGLDRRRAQIVIPMKPIGISMSTLARTPIAASELPGAKLDASKMPGHWLLARLGKRVLRPGGLELTRKMLSALAITNEDRVVELAPGLGTTMRLVLPQLPASYVAIERDEAAVRAVRAVQKDLAAQNAECRQGVAADTGLPEASASVLYGEAMLTMHTDTQKTAIIREAHRVLREGGRYGIHELALTPDDLPDTEKSHIHRDLSDSIHVGARPLTVKDWKSLLEANGFAVQSVAVAPMHLLEPARLVADEGLGGALRVVWNILKSPTSRRRVMQMRSVFRKHEARMCAVAFSAIKQAAD